MVAYVLIQTGVGVIGDVAGVIQRIQSVAGVTRTLTCPVLHE